ncbi:MAG TPA: serine hydrolase, partial [Segetibacter sp.]
GIFNGSVLITKGGDILINKGYGFKNFETKTTNDPNTIFQIGSVTKQFTSTIILSLAEQGKLSLSDKLNKYFPDFPNADKVTIENLLSHTSGIYNYTNDTSFMAHDVEKAFNSQMLFAMIKNKALEFEPGSKFSYSNSGYLLLGYIIEKVTGKKYEQVVRQQIFTPLKMDHSGFDFTHLKNADKAIGYNAITATTATKSKIVDSSVSFSAGAIFSNLSDLYRWNQSLSTEKILKKGSIENAFKTRQSKYGLGWGIDTIEGRRIITHNGGIDGFLSHNTIIPADSISITILSNSLNAKIGQISKDVFAILYNKPYKLPEEQKEIAVDSVILKQYVGEYELAPTFKITVTQVNGGLKAQATGQPQFDLFAKNENTFFLKVVDAQVEFIKNDKGEVEKLILHQNGQNVPGKKVK